MPSTRPGSSSCPACARTLLQTGHSRTGQSAAAEPAFFESPLPEITNLTRGEDAIDFAQDVREHGAAASAGPGDVEDDRGHESPSSAREPPPGGRRRVAIGGERARRAADRLRQRARSAGASPLPCPFPLPLPSTTVDEASAWHARDPALACGAGSRPSPDSPPAQRAASVRVAAPTRMHPAGRSSTAAWALAGPHQLEDEDQAEHHEQRERERDRGELDRVAQLREPADVLRGDRARCRVGGDQRLSGDQRGCRMGIGGVRRGQRSVRGSKIWSC